LKNALNGRVKPNYTLDELYDEKTIEKPSEIYERMSLIKRTLERLRDGAGTYKTIDMTNYVSERTALKGRRDLNQAFMWVRVKSYPSSKPAVDCNIKLRRIT
jgi:hypothetical protein